jgi:hypothetical protein
VARAGLRLVLLVLGVVSRLVVGRYGTATAPGLGGRRLLAGLTTAVLVRLTTLAPSDLGLLGLRHVASPVSLVPRPVPTLPAADPFHDVLSIRARAVRRVDVRNAWPGAGPGREHLGGAEMADYVLLYTGGNMPETDEERATVMAAWDAWFHELGGDLKDGGNPFSPNAASIAGDGAVRAGNGGIGATGYSIVKAGSLDEATTKAKGCPVLLGGGGITVFETFNVM